MFSPSTTNTSLKGRGSLLQYAYYAQYANAFAGMQYNITLRGIPQCNALKSHTNALQIYCHPIVKTFSFEIELKMQSNVMNLQKKLCHWMQHNSNEAHYCLKYCPCLSLFKKSLNPIDPSKLC